MTKAYLQSIMEAIQTTIQGLNLSGIDDASVVIREVPIRRDLALPAVVIAPQKTTCNPADGVLGFDDVLYGVTVRIFAADNQSQSNTATYTLWLEQVAKAFRSRRLSGVPQVITCRVEPDETIPLIGWADNVFVGNQVIKVLCREPR